MPKRIDLIGDKYHRLLVTALHSIEYPAKWICLCDCGNKTIVRGNNLRTGQVKSCGCQKIESSRNFAKSKFTTHGMSGTKTYKIWGLMLHRCNNKNSPEYKYYGARNIRVCKEWYKFENFFNDMSECPEGLSIDRINNNGNYEPGNCKWSTPAEQAVNKRNNHLLTYKGKTQTMGQWERELSFTKDLLSKRIGRGWTIERAFETRPQIKRNKEKKLSQLSSARIRNFSISTVNQ